MKSVTIGILSVLVALLVGGCAFLQGELEPMKAVISTDPAPPRGDPPLTVRFSAADSTGEITEYRWDFGDGGVAVGRVVEHTYTLPGNYVVTLRVSGPGGEAQAQVTVHVNSARPVVEYLRVDRWIVHATHAVYFYADAYDPDPDGEVRFFHWDFGNGETATTASGNISYTYESPGTFVVTLQVEDDNGDLSDPHTLQLEVLPPCPCD